MKRGFIANVVLVLLIAGSILTSVVSYKEYVLGDYCARFTIIPSCYIALFYFVILLVLQLLKKQEIIFLILLAFAMVLVSFASIGHFRGNIVCARLPNGFPACYLGLIFVVVLAILKYIQVKNNNER